MIAMNPFIAMLMLALIVAIALMCCSTLFGCAPGCDPEERMRQLEKKGHHPDEDTATRSVHEGDKQIS